MIKKLIDLHSQYAIDIRRHFHMYPELSSFEENTLNKIEEELINMGLSCYRVGKLRSVVGVIDTLRNGKTLMFRADVDALPVLEKNDISYKSTNENMHACGHDIHIASQLLTVKVLNDLKDNLNGKFMFFFQAAEEVGLGAVDAIEDNLLEGVDMILSYHVLPYLDLGQFNFSLGYRMAAYDSFEIEVNGISAHGSQPQLGADAIVCASNIVMSLQALVSRLNDAFEPLVITIGTINGGQRANIICDNVILKGSIRYYSKSSNFDLEEKIKELIEGISKFYNCKASLKYSNTLPVLENKSAMLTKLIQDATILEFSKESLVELRALPLSEDFAYFNNIDSVYGFIGSRSDLINSDKANHSDYFNPDEEVIMNAARVFARFAYDLNKID